ncbi:TetR/AcrR family transcriptional regulator [Dermacoccaceae bacterium W4C1]
MSSSPEPTRSRTRKGSARPKRRAVAARGEGTALREELIDAAILLVEEVDDPWQLSLRAVARKVGVAATSVYLHFDSLSALLKAVKSELWSRFGEQMRTAAAAAEPTPRARVLAFGRAYIAYAEQQPGAFRTLFATSWDLDLEDGDEYVGQQQFQQVVDAIAEVSGSPEDGRMRAVQLWCGLHGLVALRTPMSKFPWPDMEEQLDALAQRWTEGD